MAVIRQKLIDGFGIPDEWGLCIVVPIFKGKDDARNCGCYRAS